MPFQSHIARLLLLVVTLTIASPHFAWEAVASDAHHEHGKDGLVLFDAHDHETGFPGSDHHDDHTCTGHMFGHTPAQVSSPCASFTAGTRELFDRMSGTTYSSRDPDTFERPPRSRHA